MLMLGACGVNPGHPDPERPADPLTADQSTQQVVDVGRQLRKVADLQGVSGGFSFESCNDQGEPPYRGKVEMSSVLPAGVTPDAYARRVADAMVAAGWTDGPPPGKNPYGTVINKDGVMVVMGRAHVDGRVAYTIFGECRDTTDHRDDGATIGRPITEELLSDG
ncbi:hypothetical protein [Mycolicibacterium cosmeticum]|uniref:hypothetical protein n=1 Tax=Mycolicibacterium cosmeticum TaxID=258533 RepID=UPI00320483A8